MSDISKILYFGSPFLPIISKTNFQNIQAMQAAGKHSHLFALAHETCDIGIEHNKMHFEEFGWISTTFQVGPSEIIDFLLGFTTLPLLLMGSELLQKSSVQVAISSICHRSQDPLQLEVNQYKANTLIPLHVRLADIPSNQISKKIVIASDMCTQKPFSSNLFFLAGQNSATQTALSLALPPS